MTRAWILVYYRYHVLHLRYHLSWQKPLIFLFSADNMFCVKVVHILVMSDVYCVCVLIVSRVC